MTPFWKGMVLRAIGLFLFFQCFSGRLSLYIHERFMILTVFASFGLMCIGAAYHTRRGTSGAHGHHHSGHGHFSWSGLFLVLLLIIFGLTAPRSPLGSNALRTRRVSMRSLVSPGAQSNTRMSLISSRERTILDWVMLFALGKDLESVRGEKANVSGFVYHDEESGKELFMLARFVVSCCVTDASPVGLYVAWPESDSLAGDQWLDVSGHFEIRQIAGEATPVLMAETVTVIEPPAQAYLYP